MRLLVLGLALLAMACAQATEPRRSGYADMAPALQAMQDSDAQNPATLNLLDGAARFVQVPSSGKSCAACHADGSLRGGVHGPRGARGFREGCLDPTYYVGWTPGSDGGGAGICVTHAHNAYLEAATDAGLPGLVFFAAMALLILLAAFRGLRRGGAPLRIGLFISTLVPLWPISSTSGFTSMPNGGMWMLLAGWALAEARASKRERS
jgi:hypothetical protein